MRCLPWQMREELNCRPRQCHIYHKQTALHADAVVSTFQRCHLSGGKVILQASTVCTLYMAKVFKTQYPWLSFKATHHRFYKLKDINFTENYQIAIRNSSIFLSLLQIHRPDSFQNLVTWLYVLALEQEWFGMVSSVLKERAVYRECCLGMWEFDLMQPLMSNRVFDSQSRKKYLTKLQDKKKNVEISSLNLFYESE